MEQSIKRALEEAERDSFAKKREVLLEGRDQLQQERKDQEREMRERRKEVETYSQRLNQKEMLLDEKSASLEKQQRALADRRRRLDIDEENVRASLDKWQSALERVSNLSAKEAKQLIIESMRNKAQSEAQGNTKKILYEAKINAERQAQEVLVSVMQRVASDVNTEATVASVQIPNDDMKGRIIGREGRNIRSLETVSGADIIVDDTPDAVIVSCFDPIRKEVARRALERLIADGRIHPTRIEEVVNKASNEIGRVIFEKGQKALYDLDIHAMSVDAIKTIGKMYFRTSYGQNLLGHSVEVAVLAGMIASEVGADRAVSRRGGLLHDIGKAIVTDSDRNHVELGVDFAKRAGEEANIINCIAAHHGAVPHSCVESVIVQIADAISAARPGARHEVLDNYLKRLENLEQIAAAFEGGAKFLRDTGGTRASHYGQQ